MTDEQKQIYMDWLVVEGYDLAGAEMMMVEFSHFLEASGLKLVGNE